MIIISTKLDKFVVEPWMELEPFDPKLIKELNLNHPYKILLRTLYKYFPSYNNGEENDADPNGEDYVDVTDLYFNLLDDYNRYGIAFDREYELFPDNKLCVDEDKDLGKISYDLVENNNSKKILLFNNVKTIDLNDHDRGEKPLSEKEKQKRDIIKKQRNKKLQVAMMDPDIYNNSVRFKNVIESLGIKEILIKKFNHCMTYHGFDDFLRIKID